MLGSRLSAKGRAVKAVFWFLATVAFGLTVAYYAASGPHAAPRTQHAPYGCAEMLAQSKVLGDASSIAPLCGQTP